MITFHLDPLGRPADKDGAVAVMSFDRSISLRRAAWLAAQAAVEERSAKRMANDG